MNVLWIAFGLLAWSAAVVLLCSLFAINPREELE